MDARIPSNESGPLELKILASRPSAPEPDRGLISDSTRMSSGVSRARASGARAGPARSMAPDSDRSPTAVNMQSTAGAMRASDLKPSPAPLRNTE